MKISTKGRYALRLMLDLAMHNTGEKISLKTVSERQGISMKYLEQIITMLCRANFVKSYRGPQGGYQLTRDPDKYTVGDILRLTEGSLAPVDCAECAGSSECARYDTCVTVEVWRELYEVINRTVDKYTLADLMEMQIQKQGGNYVI